MCVHHTILCVTWRVRKSNKSSKQEALQETNEILFPCKPILHLHPSCTSRSHSVTHMSVLGIPPATLWSQTHFHYLCTVWFCCELCYWHQCCLLEQFIITLSQVLGTGGNQFFNILVAWPHPNHYTKHKPGKCSIITQKRAGVTESSSFCHPFPLSQGSMEQN